MEAVSRARAIAGGNPQAAFEALQRSNPTFAQFVQANAGKGPEQAFRDYGLDYSQVRSMF